MQIIAGAGAGLSTAAGVAILSDAQTIFDFLTAALAFTVALLSFLEIRRRRRRRSTRPRHPGPQATRNQLARYHAQLEQYVRDQDGGLQ